MNEERLKSICQKTGWNLKWDEHFFSEERFEDDVFFELIEEQDFGFALDWKYVAEDLLEGIKRCLPIDVTVGEETFLLSRLKPFNQTVERYRTITLRHGDTEKTLTYTIDEPGYLVKEILRFADYNDKEIIDINPNKEDTYWFALINKGLGENDLEPYAYNKPSEKSDSEVLANAKQATQSKYFYLPIFTSNLHQSSNDNSAGEIDLLTFKNGESFQPDYYASRVLPGQTLAEAVKHDLSSDFKYHGDFTVADYRLLDTTADKQGNQLSRLIVHIELDRFNVDGLRVLDTALQWQTYPLDVMSRQVKLGFDIEDEPIN